MYISSLWIAWLCFDKYHVSQLWLHNLRMRLVLWMTTDCMAQADFTPSHLNLIAVHECVSVYALRCSQNACRSALGCGAMRSHTCCARLRSDTHDLHLALPERYCRKLCTFSLTWCFTCLSFEFTCLNNLCIAAPLLCHRGLWMAHLTHP